MGSKKEKTPTTPPPTNPPPVTPIKKKRKKVKKVQRLSMDEIVLKVKETLKEMKTGEDMSPVEIDNEIFRLGLHKDWFNWDI